ncbi:serine/threonine-protein kinase Nek3 [Carcharodon carcharias]|uniref:serine/threonine-protein kinase Nek3 n=1 Tax=Carcharodon carcharias TaxID=13397 RepID=UPI001B7DDE1F|nr:serine/threonine-protein kinase Nek3 [Carcharodon carcharias]XP_041054483.1 serine/threonine-protein kinase Nek3 [Carcharodon carcharias]XP_041054484.1 serine/threonine-protein kinase Nek3 [Carcharodon carcharias]
MMDTYTVLKVIGEGSFGRALLVQAHNDSQHYVMKEIHLSKNPSGLQRSRREAILLAKMKHPNIVAFVDSFEADGHLYIVMEYCDGGDLTQKLLQQKEKLFPEEMVLSLFVQICLGMKHIHDKRVLHRDIKSKNIFLTKNGVVKLGDFGSAHLLNSPMAFAHTYVGTPYYVSPEIWENKPYNNKSDIWALGCVLYELCTLRHPFQSNSWKNLILKICKGTYTPIPRHYSYELQYIIKQMFKRNPKDRPSVSTILARNCFAKLISKFLSPEMVKKEFCEVKTKKKKAAQDKPRTMQKASVPSKYEDVSSSAGESEYMKTTEASADIRKWNPAEGESIAKGLAQKTLEETASQMEVTPKGDHVIIQSGKASNVLSRKQWNEFPPDTVLNILENAKLTSNMAVEDVSIGNHVTVYHKNNPRKQWSQHPPETVLNFLKNINSNLAFKTYTIDKGASGTYLIGPLSATIGKTDNVDGEMETIELDPERSEPRSDDEDTDFEEADEPDWVDELKKLLENNLESAVLTQ